VNGELQPGSQAGGDRPGLRWLPGQHYQAAAAYVAVALTVLWAAHDGGYDADTWYWGALVMLAMLVVVVGAAATRRPIGRARTVALAGLSAYALWSYASIAWAQYPGDALTGSNRTLLYLLVFAAFSLASWRPRQVLWLLTGYTACLGAIGAVLLARMATHHSATALFSEGRLISPTGYFNSNAALFMAAALLAVVLCVRAELPSLVRGVLAAIGCASLQLALLAQSRGWLFTLPAVLVVTIVVSRDRLRVALAAVLPALGALAATPALLDVYRASTGPNPTAHELVSTAGRAGRIGLLVCAGVLVLGALLATLDARSRRPPIGARPRLVIGTVVSVLAAAAAIAGATIATHGHPIHFLRTQWHGFTHPSASTSSAGSHFADIGTGRYDAWRVSVKALLAHPLGGLGQDNFADYYVRHRHTGLELQWTHSLEMRLLAHTGLVGTALFAVFLAGALTAALSRRARGDRLAAALAGAALLPLIVWLIHGSVDWFWEIPALSGPALGFLAMAGGIEEAERPLPEPRMRRRRPPRWVAAAAGALALVALVVVLAFPYLSVRETSAAGDVRQLDPGQALSDLSSAADLNPLNADPGRIGGTIALQTGQYAEAERRFEQATAREPGGWYAWLGAGLAASALGQRERAHRDFRTAADIDSLQPAVRAALSKVDTPHPLMPDQALKLLVLVH
jgi:hypothetical protein